MRVYVAHTDIQIMGTMFHGLMMRMEDGETYFCGVPADYDPLEWEGEEDDVDLGIIAKLEGGSWRILEQGLEEYAPIVEEAVFDEPDKYILAYLGIDPDDVEFVWT